MSVERPGPAGSHGHLLSSDGEPDPGWRRCWGGVWATGDTQSYSQTRYSVTPAQVQRARRSEDHERGSFTGGHDGASTALPWLRQLAEVQPETQRGGTEHAEQGF